MLPGFVVLLLFALWAFINYDFNSVLSSFGDADWRWILAGITLNVFMLYFRVFKWRFFYGAYRKISFYNMSLAAFAAYSFNMVVPARVGGLIQAWLLGKKESISKSSALGTVVLIRIIDGISLAAVGLMVFGVMEAPPEKGLYWESLKKGGLIFAAFFISITAVLFFLRKNRKFVERFSKGVTFLSPGKFKPVVQKSIISFWEGFAILNQARYFTIIIILSLIFWGLAATSIFLYLKAFSVDGISLTMPFFILLAQIVGFMIPTPGYVGPFHAATVVALSFYGIVGELALSIAIVMHAAIFLSNTIPGIIYLWFENINIFTILREAKLDVLKNHEDRVK